MTRRTSTLLALAALVVGASAGCDALRERMARRDGNHLFRQERYEEAIAEYRKILAVDPDDWDANYQIAVSYLALYHPGSTHPKDAEYAVRGVGAFERCLALEPPDDAAAEKVRDFYLSLLLAADDTVRAVSFLERRLADKPGDASLMGRLGQILARRGDYEDALGWYVRRAEALPEEKEAWYTIGVLCWERSYRGSFAVSNEERERLVARGLDALEKALAIDPDYFEALSYVNLLYREKAKMLNALGRTGEADTALRAADLFLERAIASKNKRDRQSVTGGPGA